MRGFPGGVAPSMSQVAEHLQLLTLTDHDRQVLAGLVAAHRDELRRFRSEMADVLHELG